MIDLGRQNRSKNHPTSAPRGLQAPLGTEVCFTSVLKLQFGRFSLPTWAQHGPINRSKIDQNPTWPPKGRQEASKDPFWAQLEPILAQLAPILGRFRGHFGANFKPTSPDLAPTSGQLHTQARQTTVEITIRKKLVDITGQKGFRHRSRPHLLKALGSVAGFGGAAPLEIRPLSL